MHFSNETFYHTAGPSHKAWYWIMVWDGRHHLCAVHVVDDIQYVVSEMCAVLMFYFFWNMLFWSLVQPIVKQPPFYVPDGSRFFKCNKNRCSFGVFIFSSLTKWLMLFFILLSCFKQRVLGLSGLLGLNAVIILPLYCNAVIAWRCFV